MRGKGEKKMKKVLILSLAAMVIYSCGKGDYTTTTRNTNNNNSSNAQTVTDPADNFDHLWISQASPVYSDTAAEGIAKRALANFFGYNTSHYGNPIECLPGYVDQTSMMGGTCFDSASPLKNYYHPTGLLIQAFPAPMDLGSVANYKIRFAANVDAATQEVIPGNAYIQVIISAAENFSREFVTMKTSLQVSSAICTISGTDYPCQKLKASWQDDCGDIAFVAYAYEEELINPSVTFKKTKSSYTKKACYFDGQLPSDYMSLNSDITGAIPDGIPASGVDAGRANFLYGISIADFIQQQ